MATEIQKRAVKQAVRAAGGGVVLARHLHLRRQAIYQWRRVPAEHVLKVERFTRIPRHKLRPDLYPDPAREKAPW